MQSYYVQRKSERIDGKQTTIQLHRIIMELHLGRKLERWEFVDHINHDTLDNRLENLKVKNNKGNRLNSKINRNNTSGYRGVSWCKKLQKWKVKIAIDDKSIHLGYFTNILEAAKMYDRAYLWFGGEDAVPYGMNFPDEIKARKQELQENMYKWIKN